MRRYPRALKKYDLEKRCGLARVTVRGWVPRMERYGWIKGRQVGKSNAGKRMVDYVLTERGCFQAALLNPNLRPRIKRLLGDSYTKMEDATGRRPKEYFERWLPTIKQVLQTGKAEPGFYYCLELTADKDGKIHLGKRCKVGIRPTD
jgi:hypothetical protein